MLPIYDAIAFVGVVSEGVGHNRPWILLVNTPEGVKQYVVKLFTTQQVQRNVLTSEVICNVLAREFGLSVPPAALINIPEELSLTVPPELQPQFDMADPRPKFGTEVLVSAPSYIPGLPKTQINKRISLDTLYAFDNLIKNADRGQFKTNLLMTPDLAYLIDHEFALQEADIQLPKQGLHQIDDKFLRQHIFYPLLRKGSRQTKSEYFGEFFECLRLLNIHNLTPYFQQLIHIGCCSNQQEITRWLNEMKRNSVTFVNQLRGSLQ